MSFTPLTAGNSIPTSFAPRIPETLEHLGISENLVLDLCVRRLLLEGTSTLSSLSKKLRMSVPIIDHTFRYMRAQQLVEVKGMTGNDYHFTL